MDPKKFCQAFFGVGIAVDLGGLFSPWFKQNVMNYGSRQQNNTPKIDGKSKKIHFGDSIASMKVPHSWFTSYYVFSVASSAFWGYQIYNKGAAFRFLAAHSSKDISQTMSRKQAWLIWFLMAIQGSRRLYESLVFTKPSQSRMSIVIWAM
jgi:3-oxo-5-alpha-steroid 4-dehydrogenase 3